MRPKVTRRKFGVVSRIQRDTYKGSKWKLISKKVKARDSYTCSKCKRIFPASELNAHHIKSLRSGGKTTSRNLTSLCIKCHIKHHPHMRKRRNNA